MKVNSVANATTFTRVLKVETPESDGVKAILNRDPVIKTSVVNVINTMTGQTSIYGDETSRKMGEFLKAQIGDVDDKNGVYKRKIFGEDYIFTGEDAVKAKDLVRNSIEERKVINKRYITGPDKNSSRAERVELDCKELQKVFIKDSCLRRDEALVKMADEDYEKNGSKIFITFEEDSDKAKEVKFICPDGEKKFSVKDCKVSE